MRHKIARQPDNRQNNRHLFSPPRRLAASHPTLGFTLIEILVSIALLSIMAGIGVSLFAIVNNSYSRADKISRIQSQGSSVMEGLERSIRSAIDATTAPPYGCPVGSGQCLALTIPGDSIEFAANGGCAITEYDWYPPANGSNGMLQRAWKDSSGTTCGSNGAAGNLFSTDTSKGISVELVNGQSGVFNVQTSSDSPPNVEVFLNLADGVALKPPSGSDTRSMVPFITTVSLRDYTK